MGIPFYSELKIRQTWWYWKEDSKILNLICHGSHNSLCSEDMIVWSWHKTLKLIGSFHRKLHCLYKASRFVPQLVQLLKVRETLCNKTFKFNFHHGWFYGMRHHVWTIQPSVHKHLYSTGAFSLFYFMFQFSRCYIYSLELCSKLTFWVNNLTKINL